MTWIFKEYINAIGFMKVLGVSEGFSRGWHGFSEIHLCNRCNEDLGHFCEGF